MTNNPEIYYIEDNCFRWTFEATKVRNIVETLCADLKVLNLFAGKTKLNINETRVDHSPEFNPQFCMEADDFIKLAMKNKWFYDAIIYDPPWNQRKSKEFYNGKKVGIFTKLKTNITLLLAPRGFILSVGYEITNFGKYRDMKLEKVYVINPRGEIRPYFVSIERKLSCQLAT